MRKLILSVLCLSLWSSWAGAAVPGQLYSATVDVQDHSEAQLKRATREALARVLVKITGQEELGQAPSLRRALKRSGDYLQQYQYLRDEDVLRVEVRFDEALLRELVLGAGKPLWTANRPMVLLWLVVDAPEGRGFLNEVQPEGLHTFLGEQFQRRGVPLRFPLLDLQDTMLVSSQEVWELQGASVMQASERYGVSDILVGRLTGTSSGRWIGEWMYLGQAGRAEQSVYPDDLEGFAAAGANLVADKMAEEFAVAGALPEGSGLRLRVDGLQSFADYRSLVDYLESVELIDSVRAQTLGDESLLLLVEAQASAEQLQRILGLNRRLLSQENPLPVVGMPGADLVYRWGP